MILQPPISTRTATLFPDTSLFRSVYGDTAGVVIIRTLHAIKSLGGIEKRRAAAGDDAFFNGRTGGVQRVVDAVLAFLHFNFSRAANLDHCNAASKLGKTLLELFTVVIAGDRKSTRLNSSH